MRESRLGWLVAAMVIVAALAPRVVAQGTPGARAQEPDVLNALLVEVRGLRAAMEQIGTGGARVQLALGRLQLQETRVNTMLKRHETVRDAIAKKEEELATQQGQASMFQKMFTDGKTPPEEKNPMMGMIEGFKKAVEAGTAEIQRLQAEEAQLAQQIANEQGRWAEINRALEELERSLATAPRR